MFRKIGCGVSLAIYLMAGVVQLWIMVSVVSGWVGSTVLALIVCFIGVHIPLPLFVFLYWYLDGVLSWTYIVAWIVSWGAMGLGAISNKKDD